MDSTSPSVFPPKYSFFQKVAHRLTAEARGLYEKTHPGCMPRIERTIDPEIAAGYIYDCLSTGKPAMIARFGGSELYTLANYLGVQKGIRGSWDFIRARQDQWWWMKSRIDALVNNAGFFPREEWAVVKYSLLLQEDMQYLDVLASFNSREYLFEENFRDVPRLYLYFLEPWFAEKPWTRLLSGKKVLVVHPFAELIEEQYRSKRERLFPGTDILPEFELHTVKAVQSIGGVSNGFASWFEALEWMEREMDKVDYDIALIGCGAYGFHLAAHAKRTGHQGVHLGGVLQMLFGIKGNRWEDPEYGAPEAGIPRGWYQRLFNDAWVKPGLKDRPAIAEQVEGACYW